MGVPTSEVGYTTAMPRREGHEVLKDMWWWHWKKKHIKYYLLHFILQAFDYIVTISFGYILHCVCFNLYCGGFILFCNVCVCVGFVMSGCSGNMYTVHWLRFLLTWQVFPCFFLSCRANAKVKLAKTGHGPHSSTLVVICIVRLLFVLSCVLFVCKCVLSPGDNLIAVNKYITFFDYLTLKLSTVKSFHMPFECLTVHTA
jgi:hypothetical protein